MREVLEVLLLALVRHNPGVAGHVGDGIFAADELAPIGQVLVQHAIEPGCFLDIAFNGIGNWLWRVLREVMILPSHRPQPTHLPEQPLQCFVAPP
ncbi:hypothetical protein D3C78_1841770 [compost metagenome]